MFSCFSCRNTISCLRVPTVRLLALVISKATWIKKKQEWLKNWYVNCDYKALLALHSWIKYLQSFTVERATGVWWHDVLTRACKYVSDLFFKMVVATYWVVMCLVRVAFGPKIRSKHAPICRTLTSICPWKLWRYVLSVLITACTHNLNCTLWLQMFRIGVMHGAHYIVKVDDDYCPDMVKIRKVVEDAKHPKYAYIAAINWNYAVRTYWTLPCPSDSCVSIALSFTSDANKHNCTTVHIHRVINRSMASTGNLSSTSLGGFTCSRFLWPSWLPSLTSTTPPCTQCASCMGSGDVK